MADKQNSAWEQTKTSDEPQRHAVEMHASAIITFRLITTFTFDLSP